MLWADSWCFRPTLDFPSQKLFVARLHPHNHAQNHYFDSTFDVSDSQQRERTIIIWLCKCIWTTWKLWTTRTTPWTKKHNNSFCMFFKCHVLQLVSAGLPEMLHFVHVVLTLICRPLDRIILKQWATASNRKNLHVVFGIRRPLHRRAIIGQLKTANSLYIV